jgi:hypothetical protein
MGVSDIKKASIIEVVSEEKVEVVKTDSKKTEVKATAAKKKTNSKKEDKKESKKEEKKDDKKEEVCEVAAASSAFNTKVMYVCGLTVVVAVVSAVVVAIVGYENLPISNPVCFQCCLDKCIPGASSNPFDVPNDIDAEEEAIAVPDSDEELDAMDDGDDSEDAFGGANMEGELAKLKEELKQMLEAQGIPNVTGSDVDAIMKEYLESMSQGHDHGHGGCQDQCCAAPKASHGSCADQCCAAPKTCHDSCCATETQSVVPPPTTDEDETLDSEDEEL